MRLGHEPGAETQFDVVDTLFLGVLDILVSDAAAGICVGKHTYHPLELGDEGHHAGLRIGDLHMGVQALKI